MNTKSFKLAELAHIAKAELRGDPNIDIYGVAPLESAETGKVSFLSNSRYRKFLAKINACGAVILAEKDAELFSGNCLVVSNPYAAYAKIAGLYSKLPKTYKGIHPTAIIGAGCQIADSASIEAYTVIGDGVCIGENTVIGSHCSIGEDVVLGKDCRLWSNVTLYYGVKIGHNVQIHSGTVIGSDGFGNAKENGAWLKVPQLGTVIIGDDVEIGSNTTIDRGSVGDTILEKGVILDNQIQVAHNVIIGEYTAIAACTGISGSVKIGKHCLISGMVGFTGHLEVADYVVITGMTVVSKSITKSGIYSSGTAMEPHQLWRKNAVRFRQLDDIALKVQDLERQLKALSGDKQK